MEVDPINGPPASLGWKTPVPVEPKEILREIIRLIDGVMQEDAMRRKEQRGRPRL